MLIRQIPLSTAGGRKREGESMDSEFWIGVHLEAEIGRSQCRLANVDKNELQLFKLRRIDVVTAVMLKER